jgi:hypothetical protein
LARLAPLKTELTRTFVYDNFLPFAPKLEEAIVWNEKKPVISTRNCLVLFDRYIHGGINRREFLECRCQVRRSAA